MLARGNLSKIPAMYSGLFTFKRCFGNTQRKSVVNVHPSIFCQILFYFPQGIVQTF